MNEFRCRFSFTPKLAELEARSMRYEMACGKDDLYGQPCVVGSANKPA